MNHIRRLNLALCFVLAAGIFWIFFRQTTNLSVRAAAPSAPTTVSNFLPIIINNAGPIPAWLTYVNYLRSLAGLPAVSENTTFSDGDVKHARYMVKNNFIGHTEDTSNAWYTLEGLAAAQNGNVAVNSDMNATDNSAIDGWMTGPFHGLGIIDPRLMQTGFGSYREATAGWSFAATLDVLRGQGTVPAGVTFPVKWPTDGQAAPYTSFAGNESPAPLTSCPGYTAPSGMPIYLLLGAGNSVAANVTAFSFKQGAITLESCEFDGTNYSNPDADQQNLARSILSGRSAIVIMPRLPLTRGATYTVSVTSGGTTTSWSFTVSNTAATPVQNSAVISR